MLRYDQDMFSPPISIPPPATDVEIPASSVYLGEFRSAWQWDVRRVKSFDAARTCDKHDSSLRRLYHGRFFFILCFAGAYRAR